MGTRFYGGRWRVIVCLLLLACAIPGAWAALAWKTNRLQSISIGGNTFSNVTVIEVTRTTVTISHSRGMASFNPNRLLRTDKEQLGLIERPPEPAPKQIVRTEQKGGSNAFSFPSASLSGTNAASLPAHLERLMPKGVRKFLDELPPFRPVMLVGPIIVYLFLCVCFLQICRKAGKPSPLLVWIPILQALPLYRAARMSPFWFALLAVQASFQIAFLFATPPEAVTPRMMMIFGLVLVALAVIQLVGWIAWSFKICAARDKSPVLGIFMLLPCTNVFALAYLAFSK